MDHPFQEQIVSSLYGIYYLTLNYNTTRPGLKKIILKHFVNKAADTYSIHINTDENLLETILKFD